MTIVSISEKEFLDSISNIARLADGRSGSLSIMRSENTFYLNISESVVATCSPTTIISYSPSLPNSSPSPTPSSTPDSIDYISTEQLSITNVQWSGTGSTITVTVRNTGTTDVVINSATVNGVSAPITSSPVTVPKNSALDVNLAAHWLAGDSYQIKLISAKGNNFLYNAVASP